MEAPLPFNGCISPDMRPGLMALEGFAPHEAPLPVADGSCSLVNGWQLCSKLPLLVAAKQLEALNVLSTALGVSAPVHRRVVIQPANMAAAKITPPVSPDAQVNYRPACGPTKPQGALSVWVQLTGSGSVVIDVGSTQAKSFLTLNARAEVWEELKFMQAVMIPGHASFHNSLLPHRQHSVAFFQSQDLAPLWNFFMEAVYDWPTGPPLDLHHYDGAGYDYASLAAANCANFARRKRRRFSC